MSEPTREQIARTINLAMHRVWYPEEEHDGSEPLEAHFEAADDVLALFRAPAKMKPRCGKPAGELICNNDPGHKGKCGWTVLREERAHPCR